MRFRSDGRSYGSRTLDAEHRDERADDAMLVAAERAAWAFKMLPLEDQIAVVRGEREL